MNFAILAAGEGSRLSNEGVSKPKPLVEIDGRPMVRRLLDIYARCGAEVVAVIVNQQMHEVADYLREIQSQLPYELRMIERTTPSSMHSFYEVSTLLPDGKFVMSTVDTIFREEAFHRYVEAFERDAESDGYMGVTEYIDDERPLYIDTDSEGLITAYRDQPSNHDRLISAGIYGLKKPSAIDVLSRCVASGMLRMRRFQRAMVETGFRLRAYSLGKVIDVDHASDVAKAQELIESK